MLLLEAAYAPMRRLYAARLPVMPRCRRLFDDDFTVAVGITQ